VNTIHLLRASRRQLLAIRKEAVSTADEYEASNKELVTINRDLRELLERPGASASNPAAAAYADLISVFSGELNAPGAGVAPFEKNCDAHTIAAWHENAARRVADLTPRQRQIMVLVVNGQPSKIIAADLHISQRTVENHRAQIMKRTESKSLPALARLALFALKSSAEELLEVTQQRVA
jgi:DNA-binding CsgD family transcriptional regulator